MTLKDSRRIEATLVLLLTGVTPATRFIHDLPLNDNGSLTVDETMKVTEDIYAIGDIATFPLNGKADPHLALARRASARAYHRRHDDEQSASL